MGVLRAVAGGVVLLAFSCGGAGEVCRNASTLVASLDSKGCSAASLRTFDPKLCEQRISLCSPEEARNLGATVDCLEKVPACTGPDDPDFVVNFFRCEALYSGATAECVASVFGQK